MSPPKKPQPNPTKQGPPSPPPTPPHPHPSPSPNPTEPNETTAFETTSHRLCFILHIAFTFTLPFSFSSFDLLCLSITLIFTLLLLLRFYHRSLSLSTYYTQLFPKTFSWGQAMTDFSLYYLLNLSVMLAALLLVINFNTSGFPQ
jgi:hypothetical protein